MREVKSLDILIDDALEESNSFLEIYKLELEHLEEHLKYLENHKPLSLMKKSLINYEREVCDTTKKIERCHDKINEELTLIDNLIKNKNTRNNGISITQ